MNTIALILKSFWLGVATECVLFLVLVMGGQLGPCGVGGDSYEIWEVLHTPSMWMAEICGFDLNGALSSLITIALLDIPIVASLWWVRLRLCGKGSPAA